MENEGISEIGGDGIVDQNVRIYDIGGDRFVDLKRKSPDEEEKKELKSDEEEKKKRKSNEEFEDDDDSFNSSESDDSATDEEVTFGTDDEVGEDDETSNFTEQQVVETKVKPEEIKVELDEEEKKFYRSEEYRWGAYYASRKVKKGSFVYHMATDEEMKQLQQAILKTGGFDIPLLPGSIHSGTVRCNLSHKGHATHVAKNAKCALVYYNKKYGTDYVLRRLVKSNVRPCCLVVYLITFLATSAELGGLTKTFQAKVHRHLTGDIHVMMCKIKPVDDQPQLEVGARP